jgi:hypothetical protein
MPFPFEQNVGQADAAVRYLLRAGAVQAGFASGGFQLMLSDSPPRPGQSGQADPIRDAGTTSVVAVDLVGASASAPVGAIPSDTAVSYFKGSPDQWLVGVPTFQRLTYPNAWPGIDVTYERSPGVSGLKSTFVVAPNADAARIHEAWRGVSDARLLEDGTLELRTPNGMLREAVPVAWQARADGGRDVVGARFALLASSDDVVEVGFDLDAYDIGRPLTIDPPITFAGYIGGGDTDQAAGVAVDNTGAAYVTGTTRSSAASGFPVATGPNTNLAGGTDAFVAKVKPDGSGLIFAGYIGGTNDETALGVAVDSTGSAYIAGSTLSAPGNGFPVAVGPSLTYQGGGDGFVAKLKPDGTGLVYAGYIGGTGIDSATGIAVDGSGAAYVAGYTESAPTNSFPAVTGPSTVYGGSGDTYIAKVRPDGGGLTYAGYIGGNQQEFAGQSVAVDTVGAAYVVGFTKSTPAQGFPAVVGPSLTNNGEGDGFVAKVRPDGTGLNYAGYIGGSDLDQANGIAIDSSGNAYVVGLTRSSTGVGFPVVVGPSLTYKSNGDAFISKVRSDGAGLVYSGYIGGSQDDSAISVAVDASGRAAVVGSTRSSPNEGFPVGGGLNDTYKGNRDAFVAQVQPDGAALTFAGYIGGSQADQGIGVAVDANGAVYAVGDTQSDPGAGFPVSVGPSLTYRGNTDGWVAKIAGSATPTPTATVTVTPTATVTATPVPPVCTPRPRVITQAVSNGDGRLRVTISSTTNPGPPNGIRSILWGTMPNATVNVVGVGQVTQGQRTVFPSTTTSVVLLVSRVTVGQASTVNLTVTDGCGDWPTLAGGGPTAF